MTVTAVRFIRCIDMEKNENKTSGVLPAILIAALACLTRLIGLGGAALSMNEAENALTAADLFATNGSGAGQLLYELPTALLFKLFGESEFTARLFPAVCGILLALLPLFFMNRLGRGKALTLGFLLALDPVLLFWSKRADALLPSVLMTAIAGVCLYLGMNARGLLFLLLALCGGERAWPAVIILVILTALEPLANKVFRPVLPGKKDLAAVCLGFLALILCFGAFPGGIACFGNGFVNAFSALPDWTRPGAAAMLIAVFLYLGIPLLLVILRCVFERTAKYLAQAALFALPALLWMGITALPYVSLLLWLIAADVVLGMVEAVRGAEKRFAFWVTACAVPGVYSYFWFRLVDLFRYPTTNQAASVLWNGQTVTLPFSRMTASVILTVISILIIVLVVKILSDLFDPRVFYPGLICGGMIIMLWGLVTNAWTAGNFDREADHPASARASGSITLLDGGDAAAADSAFLKLFEETRAKRGDASNRPWVLNLASDDAILRWQLRDVDGIENSGNIHSNLDTVDVILDPDETHGYSYAGFSGGLFTLEKFRNFRSYSLYDWGKWILFRDGPTVSKSISMWVDNQYLIMQDTGETEYGAEEFTEAQ